MTGNHVASRLGLVSAPPHRQFAAMDDADLKVWLKGVIEMMAAQRLPVWVR
jgi:hypothetical protein